MTIRTVAREEFFCKLVHAEPLSAGQNNGEHSPAGGGGGPEESQVVAVGRLPGERVGLARDLICSTCVYARARQ